MASGNHLSKYKVEGYCLDVARMVRHFLAPAGHYPSWEIRAGDMSRVDKITFYKAKTSYDSIGRLCDGKYSPRGRTKTESKIHIQRSRSVQISLPRTGNI